MNNFSINYGKILETLQQVEDKMNFLNQKHKPRLTDVELIAIDLTAEYMGIDSEYQLFRIFPESLGSKIERSVYNRRRRNLFYPREQLRKRISEQISSNTDYYIVDSIPLEVCRLSRSSRKGICHENFETSPDSGYCATQKLYYYGYKLHAVCNTDGVFSDFELTKASVHDIHYLKNVKQNHYNCTVLGDKG